MKMASASDRDLYIRENFMQNSIGLRVIRKTRVLVALNIKNKQLAVHPHRLHLKQKRESGGKNGLDKTIIRFSKKNYIPASYSHYPMLTHKLSWSMLHT